MYLCVCACACSCSHGVRARVCVHPFPTADVLRGESLSLGERLAARMETVLDSFRKAGVMVPWKLMVCPLKWTLRVVGVHRFTSDVCVCVFVCAQTMCCGFRCIFAVKSGRASDGVAWALRGADVLRTGVSDDPSDVVDIVVAAAAARFVVTLREAGKLEETVTLTSLMQQRARVLCPRVAVRVSLFPVSPVSVFSRAR